MNVAPVNTGGAERSDGSLAVLYERTHPQATQLPRGVVHGSPAVPTK